MCSMESTEGTNQQPAQPVARQTPVIWPWLLVGGAWALAGFAVLTNHNSLIDHHYLLEESHLPVLVALGMFLIGFQVMIMGMMLPSSMPTISLMVHVGRQQKHPQAIPTAFLAGYTVVWTAFALVTFLGDTQIHWLTHHWSWLDTHTWILGATIFAIAGIFQFSPLKDYCLKQCRTPFSILKQTGVGAAWHLGLRHGIFCLGNCWALMLVMFAMGMSSLVSMALLTGVMVIEKTYPGGQRLSPVIGIIMMGLAALWLVHPTWFLDGFGL